MCILSNEVTLGGFGGATFAEASQSGLLNFLVGGFGAASENENSGGGFEGFVVFGGIFGIAGAPEGRPGLKYAWIGVMNSFAGGFSATDVGTGAGADGGWAGTWSWRFGGIFENVS